MIASLHVTALIQEIHNFAVADKNPQQHVPVQEYSENLKEIARFLASVGVSAGRVIFISPPPVHEPAWEKECILKGSIYSHHLTSQVSRHQVALFVYFRVCPQSSQLCSRAVRTGVCAGCCSVWHRCA